MKAHIKVNVSDKKEATEWWLWVVAMVVLTSIIFGIFRFMSKPAQVLDLATDPHHILAMHELFEENIADCQAVCDRITVLELTPDDYEEGGFTKAALMRGETNKLVSIISEYNANSRKMNVKFWKNRDLPTKLDVNSICN